MGKPYTAAELKLIRARFAAGYSDEAIINELRATTRPGLTGPAFLVKRLSLGLRRKGSKAKRKYVKQTKQVRPRRLPAALLPTTTTTFTAPTREFAVTIAGPGCDFAGDVVRSKAQAIVQLMLG
jgi:hypothetical protein